MQRCSSRGRRRRGSRHRRPDRERRRTLRCRRRSAQSEWSIMTVIRGTCNCQCTHDEASPMSGGSPLSCRPAHRLHLSLPLLRILSKSSESTLLLLPVKFNAFLNRGVRSWQAAPEIMWQHRCRRCGGMQLQPERLGYDSNSRIKYLTQDPCAPSV